MDESMQKIESSKEENEVNTENVLIERYDKHIRHARIALFGIAGAELVSGLFFNFQLPQNLMLNAWIEVIIICAIFVALGFWSKKKPFTAVLTGLIIFVVFEVLYAITDPVNIMNGIIFKIVVIFFLAKGLSDAKKAEFEKRT